MPEWMGPIQQQVLFFVFDSTENAQRSRKHDFIVKI